jgi:divalent metal cation (Fe/Co/Zn/Cd) transporter
VEGRPLELPLRQPPPVSPRPGLVRRARVLAWLGVAWHAVEAFVAIAAGVAAGSIALIGFGADSVVDCIAGIVVIWRFAARREATADAERRAQRLIAASFFAIAVYVSVEASLSLIGTDHPQASWVGIGLSIVTLVVMPPLATAKGRVARQLGSSATHSEGRQNMLCAYLSAALLAGLGVNALFGWWWGDPAAALLISGFAVREGVDAWRGDACCDVC